MLEGLKEGGVKTLWEELPRHCSQDEDLKKVFYNSEFGFSQRLYGTFDVDLPRIRLYYPLKSIVQFPLIYIQGKIPPASFRYYMHAWPCNMYVCMYDPYLGTTTLLWQ